MWGLLKVQVFGLQLRVGDGMSAPLTIRPEILLHGTLGVGQWGMGSAPGCSSWRLTRVPHTMLVIPICPALGVAEGCPILQMGKVEAVPQLLASLGVLLEP